MALPTLTDEQRAEYSKRAAAARKARADLKARIKRGEVALETVLGSEDPVVLRMRVRDLLVSLPGVGPKKAGKLMDEAGIAGSRRVSGLGIRQREKLLEAYGEAVA